MLEKSCPSLQEDLGGIPASLASGVDNGLHLGVEGLAKEFQMKRVPWPREVGE